MIGSRNRKQVVNASGFSSFTGCICFVSLNEKKNWWRENRKTSIYGLKQEFRWPRTHPTQGQSCSLILHFGSKKRKSFTFHFLPFAGPKQLIPQDLSEDSNFDDNEATHLCIARELLNKKKNSVQEIRSELKSSVEKIVEENFWAKAKSERNSQLGKFDGSKKEWNRCMVWGESTWKCGMNEKRKRKQNLKKLFSFCYRENPEIHPNNPKKQSFQPIRKSNYQC